MKYFVLFVALHPISSPHEELLSIVTIEKMCQPYYIEKRNIASDFSLMGKMCLYDVGIPSQSHTVVISQTIARTKM